jgi:hypothetical protein
MAVDDTKRDERDAETRDAMLQASRCVKAEIQ